MQSLLLLDFKGLQLWPNLLLSDCGEAEPGIGWSGLSGGETTAFQKLRVFIT